jgi:hypothetical protein
MVFWGLEAYSVTKLNIVADKTHPRFGPLLAGKALHEYLPIRSLLDTLWI